MNNAFHNLVSLNKLREQLLKKKCISFLLLMTLAALLATLIATCARSNVTIGDRPSTTGPFRMLDKTHGWALTQSSILKTEDGGLHWQDVTPAHANLDESSESVFLNDQDAWVITSGTTPDLCAIIVLYTTDGGKSWQSWTTIPTTYTDGVIMVDFVNPSDGWLQVYNGLTMTQHLSIILHTTDGGQHWNELANIEAEDASGIFFSDTQNGWQSGDNSIIWRTGAALGTAARPGLEVTHDGGQTWHDVQLPILPGAGKDEIAQPTSPVFFGKNGLLPVQDLQAYGNLPDIGLDLYVTHDGGQTWTPTKFLPLKGDYRATIDVVDMYHVWAAVGTDLYATSNGGQSWTQLPQPPQVIGELSFLDTHNGWAIDTTTDMTKKQPPNLLHTTDGGRTWQSIDYSIVGKSTATLSAANRDRSKCPD